MNLDELTRLNPPSVCPGWLMDLLIIATIALLLIEPIADWWHEQRCRHEAFLATRRARPSTAPRWCRDDPSPKPHPTTTRT